MIASLYGAIRSLNSDQLVVDVNGVGYLVNVTASTSSKLGVGRNFLIYTSMVVREDSMTLYGFIESAERDLFELVQTVSGIGPKVALAITASMSTEELAHAVNRKDAIAISQVPGIGKKGAQRLILELAGKLEFSRPQIKSGGFSWREQLVEALTGLGFTRRQAESAVNEISSGIDVNELSKMAPSELLKLALNQTKSQKGLSK